MKRLALLIAAFVLCAPAQRSEAVKVVDPNAPPAGQAPALAESAPIVDERLSQKVTYEAGSKRLHVVLEELTAQTSVTIRCGKNKDDWRVRDIPVIVCARDVPLGKLLRAIADATHLLFSASAIEAVRSYRIYRDVARQTQLDDFLQARKDYFIAQAGVNWDTWAAFGATPDVELKSRKQEPHDTLGAGYACRREYGKLINTLGPDAKKRIMSGERIVLSANDRSKPIADAVTALYRETLRMQSERRAANSGQVPEPYASAENEEPGDIRLVFHLTSGDYPSLMGILVCPQFCGSPDSCVDTTRIRSLLKQPPASPRPPGQPQTTLPKEFWEVQGAKAAETPEINVDVELAEWKGKDKPSFADDIERVSRSFGYAIVCEDFTSHKSDVYGNPDRLPEKKLCLHLALAKLSQYSAMRWFMDPEDKVIVGSNREWYDRHANLVPESLLVSLRQKMDTTGLELDDYLPILRLSWGQREDWIQTSAELRQLSTPASTGMPLWQFYDSLNREDKALTTSEGGLPVGKFDPAYMANVFARWLKAVDGDDYAEFYSSGDKQRPNKDRVPRDPDVISKLALKVETETRKPYFARYSPGGGSTHESDPRGIERRAYRMMVKGESTALRIDGPPLDFPVFSRKRETQLWEQAQKASETPQSTPDK